jgi:sulfur-carrier protein
MEVDGSITVAELLDRLAVIYPELERCLRDEQGTIRPHVNMFIGGENIRSIDGLASELIPGAVLTMLPAVSGGCHDTRPAMG